MATVDPVIICLCPTYKRPQLLRNAIACFEAQTYQNRFLLILDDAGQHEKIQSGDDWCLKSTEDRHGSLSKKFGELANWSRTLVSGMAWFHETGGSYPTVLAVWEDDDIYLPHHLSGIAAAYTGGKQFFAPSRALSNYQQPKGTLINESAAGRFHASWAYTLELWQAIGGYPDTDRLDFDQQMHGIARKAAGGVTDYNVGNPSYVYRWGNGIYHGSQAGETGYRELWERLGRLPGPWVGQTGPEFDAETRVIYESYAGVTV